MLYVITFWKHISSPLNNCYVIVLIYSFQIEFMNFIVKLWLWFFNDLCKKTYSCDILIDSSQWRTNQNSDSINSSQYPFTLQGTTTLRVYSISRRLNHQLKLLIEMVPWHGIRSQRDKMLQVRISTTPHLEWNIQRQRQVGGAYVLHPHFKPTRFSCEAYCERSSL